MKIYSKTIILITLLLATSSQIQAKDNMKHKKQRPNFSSLDINSDGVIDFDEFSSHKIPHAVHQTVFNNIDTDDSLTQEQQQLISNTLSQFDAKTLTEVDAIRIKEAFSDAGIQPDIGLEKALSELGFDAKNIGDLANVSDREVRPAPSPPPNQSSGEISSILEFLAELLEEKLVTTNENGLSDEDKQSIMEEVFEKFNIEQGDSIINVTA